MTRGRGQVLRPRRLLEHGRVGLRGAARYTARPVVASTQGVWVRRGLWVATLALSTGAAALLYVDGRFPAPVPADAPPLEVSALGRALEAVSLDGEVKLGELRERRASLRRYIAALAATTPATAPAAFPTADERLAFWLNAYHALVLEEVADAAGGLAPSEGARVWAIGGQRMTRRALRRRFLSRTGDGRMALALFTGARGSGVLDGAPFDGQTLDAQLDDAMRRFVRRRDNVALDGKALRVSALLERHETELLAALPDGRRGLTHILWAYLPDDCEGLRPGCLTRGELDRNCGPAFDRCTLTFTPVDETLAVAP